MARPHPLPPLTLDEARRLVAAVEADGVRFHRAGGGTFTYTGRRLTRLEAAAARLVLRQLDERGGVA